MIETSTTQLQVGVLEKEQLHQMRQHKMKRQSTRAPEEPAEHTLWDDA